MSGKRRAQAVDGECGIEVSAANQHQVHLSTHCEPRALAYERAVFLTLEKQSGERSDRFT
eukprot:1866582-Amphidinium_carterae.2